MPVVHTKCANIMRGACVAPVIMTTSNPKPLSGAGTVKGHTMQKECASIATIDRGRINKIEGC